MIVLYLCHVNEYALLRIIQIYEKPASLSHGDDVSQKLIIETF